MASVSTATVSRLITGAARVSPKTARRIFHAMEVLNFKPNEAARVLAFQKRLKNAGGLARDCRSVDVSGRSARERTAAAGAQMDR